MYLPAVALMIVFVIYPLIQGVHISLTNWNGYSQTYKYVGLQNYRKLFTDVMFHTAFRNTLVYGFGSALIQTGLGLLYALLLQDRFCGRTFARTVIYIPVMVSQLIAGYIWYFMVQYDQGALNDIMLLLGAEPLDWMAQGARAVVIITLINGVQYVGKTMIIFIAGLNGIPTDYYEAASLDGAGAWQRFRYITLPQLLPALATNIILNLIGGLKLFGIVVSMTGGGPGYASHSLQTLINYTYFENQSAGYSAAIGLFTFVFIMFVSVVVRGYIEKKAVELN
ncbi:sugar ABC transporter permease [Enterocloster lavalensis]|uniref:Carbohydrate ABC transporter membrane protein 1, CUT1 family n=3 Tax=Lachnospiraceae TaxID=186803 RepID=A0A1I0GCY4_9FIRM|nr:sugar ABC transporter permease [Enterocloster lavalensis]MBS5602719.1 sugar ABC transporter permease [Enterocloster asparagiformis]MDR3755273.1 sugar ABC transporter permease [Enterocloster sp.]PST34930.1 sugar ABC transporter permease [Enterocloster lavalensis]SET68004.1 carbohydrate ABC transporter membrane protein 1, CUT1 family [Enterocloster lavalensis]